MATLAVSGLPMLQYDNRGAIVATDSLIRQLNMGVFFTNMQELGEQLHDVPKMNELRESVWQQREQFTFDYHADRLVDFFREVIR